jgi:hypothetical protein
LPNDIEIKDTNDTAYRPVAYLDIHSEIDIISAILVVMGIRLSTINNVGEIWNRNGHTGGSCKRKKFIMNCIKINHFIWLDS